jgi:hypothetical protein
VVDIHNKRRVELAQAVAVMVQTIIRQVSLVEMELPTQAAAAAVVLMVAVMVVMEDQEL